MLQCWDNEYNGIMKYIPDLNSGKLNLNYSPSTMCMKGFHKSHLCHRQNRNNGAYSIDCNIKWRMSTT